MNNQREVVYTYRNEAIDTEDPRKLVYEVIDEAVPAKVTEFLGTGASGDEPNHSGLLNWVNITFPLGLTKEKAQFETRMPEENAEFLIEKIKEAYERKSQPRRTGRGQEPRALYHSECHRSALAGASLCDGCACAKASTCAATRRRIR